MEDLQMVLDDAPDFGLHSTSTLEETGLGLNLAFLGLPTPSASPSALVAGEDAVMEVTTVDEPTFCCDASLTKNWRPTISGSTMQRLLPKPPSTPMQLAVA